MQNKALKFLIFLSLICLFKDGLSQVPENLTSSRSVVIMDVPDEISRGFVVRSDWKKVAAQAHGSLRKIGVDAIMYLNRGDLQCNPEITLVYENVLAQRKVSNLILLKVAEGASGKEYRLNIYDKVQGIALFDPYYTITAASIEELMLLLGRQVIRQNLERSNFLILDRPEYLDDLTLHKGTRYTNVPTRLKSQTLGVILFDTVSIPPGLSENNILEIRELNQSIRNKNDELKSIMSRYPFKYKFTYFKDVKDLYQQGYQYALFPVISSGKTVKQMLDYETSEAETMYVSETFHLDGKPTLKKIPVNASQTKYYIKQTIVDDIHVGKRWDADVTWQSALNNFLDNLIYDLNPNN